MSCVNCGHESMNHPDGECYMCDCTNFQMAGTTAQRGKEITRMEWQVTVKSWGNTGGITVPKSLVGKRVRVSVEVVE